MLPEGSARVRVGPAGASKAGELQEGQAGCGRQGAPHAVLRVTCLPSLPCSRWGTVFPVGTFTGATIQLWVKMGSQPFRVIAAVLDCLLAVQWAAVTLATLWYGWDGSLFLPPAAAAQQAQQGGGVLGVLDAEAAEMLKVGEPDFPLGSYVLGELEREDVGAVASGADCRQRGARERGAAAAGNSKADLT